MNPFPAFAVLDFRLSTFDFRLSAFGFCGRRPLLLSHDRPHQRAHPGRHRHRERAPEGHANRTSHHAGASDPRRHRAEQCERPERRPGDEWDQTRCWSNGRNQERQRRANAEAARGGQRGLDRTRADCFRDPKLITGVRPQGIMDYQLVSHLLGK